MCWWLLALMCNDDASLLLLLLYQFSSSLYPSFGYSIVAAGIEIMETTSRVSGWKRQGLHVVDGGEAMVWW